MDNIINKQLYGMVKNYTYAIEFQKRGLPYAHVVGTFTEDDRIENEDNVVKIISATIPDQNSTPTLYKILKDYKIIMCIHFAVKVFQLQCA